MALLQYRCTKSSFTSTVIVDSSFTSLYVVSEILKSRNILNEITADGTLYNMADNRPSVAVGNLIRMLR